PDYNAERQDGFGYYQLTQKNARRWSAADAYLHPARKRENLRVVTNAFVARLLLEGKRCVGVDFERGGKRLSARCRLEVVLAAGAVQSPMLLELSGIGDGEHLRHVGIEVQHHLPGVGENYRDHMMPRLSWRVTRPIT